MALAHVVLSYRNRRFFLKEHEWVSLKSSLVVLLGLKDECMCEFRVCLLFEWESPIECIGAL